MQLYLPGKTPLFWEQLSALPNGFYNQQNNQASAALIPHLFVAFVPEPIGATVSLFMNGSKVADMKVVDDTGFVYTELFLPHTKGQDLIDFLIKNGGGITLASETFSTSNIAYAYEIQSAVSQPILNEAIQLGDNNSIIGVAQDTLEDKYGIYTQLSRRNDQDIEDYRDQTSCIWGSFQYASMVKGLVDSLKCVLGDVSIGVSPTRLALGNRIFDKPQYDDNNTGPSDPPFEGVWVGPSITLVRSDTDKPHYYVADIPEDYRLSYPSTEDPLSIILLGVVAARPEADNNPEVWDNVAANKIQSLIIRSAEAIGNEVVINVEEDDATVSIVDEEVSRQIGVTTDQLANVNIASAILVTGATTPSTSQPVEGPDFSVDILTGIITWNGTTEQPIDGTTYKVEYLFRLDNAIRKIVQQIKPVQRSIVVIFNNKSSALPTAIEI